MENPVKYWHNFNRAYEVALMAGVSLRVIAPLSYKAAAADYEYIKQNFTGVEYSAAGVITVEIDRPLAEVDRAKYETVQDIKDRVQHYKENYPEVKPEPRNIRDRESCETLLKKVFRCSHPTVKDRENVLIMAAAIARPDGGIIQTWHVAEAVQYLGGFIDSPVQVLEAGAVNFGPGITIKQHGHEPGDITAAIDYLNKLKEV